MSASGAIASGMRYGLLSQRRARMTPSPASEEVGEKRDRSEEAARPR